MKKYISLLLALLMLFCTVTALASCGKEKPELNLKTAAKNLEKAGYEIHYEDDDIGEIFDLDLSFGAVEYLEANDDDENFIGIAKFESEKIAKLFYKALKLELEDEIKYYEQNLEYYEAVLKKGEKSLSSDDIDDIKDYIKYCEEELELYETLTYGRDGDIIWVGTERAIKDSK